MCNTCIIHAINFDHFLLTTNVISQFAAYMQYISSFFYHFLLFTYNNSSCSINRISPIGITVFESCIREPDPPKLEPLKEGEEEEAQRYTP
jgi:hypothetical protein